MKAKIYVPFLMVILSASIGHAELVLMDDKELSTISAQALITVKATKELEEKKLPYMHPHRKPGKQHVDLWHEHLAKDSKDYITLTLNKKVKIDAKIDRIEIGKNIPISIHPHRKPGKKQVDLWHRHISSYIDVNDINTNNLIIENPSIKFNRKTATLELILPVPNAKVFMKPKIMRNTYIYNVYEGEFTTEYVSNAAGTQFHLKGLNIPSTRTNVDKFQSLFFGSGGRIEIKLNHDGLFINLINTNLSTFDLRHGTCPDSTRIPYYC